jgi:hypothetical protein
MTLTPPTSSCVVPRIHLPFQVSFYTEKEANPTSVFFCPILYSDRENTSLKTGFKGEKEGHEKSLEAFMTVVVIEIREQETQIKTLFAGQDFSGLECQELFWFKLT